MKYTLIAYKPEKSYWCGGDKEIHSANLIREDNLTRNEVVNKIFELSKDPEYLKDGSWLYSDCPYDDFHIFEYKENEEEFDDFYFMKEEARKLAFDFNKEGKRKQKERWDREKEEKNKKESEKKKLEYEKLKLEFEGKQ